jgi:hypothetical protein
MACARWSGRHFYRGPCRRSFMRTNQVWGSLPHRCHARRRTPSLAIRFPHASSPLSHLSVPPSCIPHASVYRCTYVCVCPRRGRKERSGEQLQNLLSQGSGLFFLCICTGAVLSGGSIAFCIPGTSLRTLPANCGSGLVRRGKCQNAWPSTTSSFASRKNWGKTAFITPTLSC